MSSDNEGSVSSSASLDEMGGRRNGDLAAGFSLDRLKSALSRGQPGARIRYLKEDLAVSQSFPPHEHSCEIVEYLLDVFERTTYGPLAGALVATLGDFMKRDAQLQNSNRAVQELVCRWIESRVASLASSAKTIAPSLLFPYVALSAQLYDIIAAQPDSSSSKEFHSLVLSLALSLNGVLSDPIEGDPESTTEGKAKATIRKGALVRSRRAIRNHWKLIPDVQSLLIAEVKKSNVQMLPLLGVTIGVSLRLKGKESASKGKEWVREKKAEIIDLYSSAVLGSKSSIPSQVVVSLACCGSGYRFYRSTTESNSKSISQSSLDDVWSSQATEEDFASVILPEADKMLIRSPEVALPILTHVFASTSADLSALIPKHVVPGLISASKSSKALTRLAAVDCAPAVASRLDPDSLYALTMDLLQLPTSGKTTSADNRACLLEMISRLPSAPHTSDAVVKGLVPLVSKETNENALSALFRAVSPHLAHCISDSQCKEPSKATIQILTKELSSVKAATKKHMYLTIGQALWDASTLGATGHELLEALKAPFENALKPLATQAAAANTLIPVEAYVVAGVALKYAKEAHGLGALVETHPVLSKLPQTQPKPSFLINERNVRKTLELENDASSKIWMLRAVQMTSLAALESQKLDESLCVALGTPLILSVLEQKEHSIQRQGRRSIEELIDRQPAGASSIVLASLHAWLKRDNARGGERINNLLRTLASKLPSESLATFLQDVFLLAHHPAAAPTNWIELTQRSGIDPATFVQQREQELTAIVAAEEFRQAAYNAITTLVTLSPNLFVPLYLEQTTTVLDIANFAEIGETDIGIYQMPEGTPFVDVLNQKKENGNLDKNDKNFKQEQWDREVREAIAKKKAASGLSKSDQAAVNAQLKKEASIRSNLNKLKTKTIDAVRVLAALLRGRSEEFDRHVKDVQQVILPLTTDMPAFFVGAEAAQFYQDLSAVCEPMDKTVSRFVGVALLRSLGSPNIAQELLEEPLGELVTRLLHRLLSIASSNPLSGPATTYILPLLSGVIENKGLGWSSEHRDESLEQLTLAIEVYGCLVHLFTSNVYPRLEVIRDLLHAASTVPTLVRPALDALAELGSAMAENPTQGEIDTLLEGLLSDSHVRNGALTALEPLDLTELEFPAQLYIARFDEDQHNAKIADSIWEDNGLDVPELFIETLLPFLANDRKDIALAAAKAFADAAAQYPQQIDSLLARLREFYAAKAQPLAPQFDKFGMIIPESVGRSDPFPARVATATVFGYLSPLLSEKQIIGLFEFLVIEEALGDHAEQARQALLAAAIKMVEEHGEGIMAKLMVMFETYLGSKQTGDDVRHAVVILYGTLASHLPSGDKRLPKVIDDLIAALDSNSELVQEAVAECLAPLTRKAPERADALAEHLLDTLLGDGKYGTRIGAAYGLAGIVKGRGLALLSESDVMSRLQAAVNDKKSWKARQGSVLAFRTLIGTLGRAFEPYIISIIPALLTLFGDTNAEVRQDTADAAKVIMSKISGHCVKTILPQLLSGLEEKQWRTKKGSIELLGAMAFCAPKQLSLSLPTIIPHLTGVITDSHAQVSSAAKSSLKTFGEVLNNPEIKKMQPVLLKALSDPTTKTNGALTSLLGTSFEHYIDPPSLALVVPILDRGLRDRGSETKKKAVQIVGNLASLTESRDFISYLNQLMPLVQNVLADAVPEARATAAKALGTLVERLGEENFPSLIGNLLQTLRTDTATADRQGAAQGLAEVLAGLGMTRMEGLLPDIVTAASSSRSYVREGFISLLVYLPATFGQRFAPHLARIIPPILGGLADESEFVREASMRAGKMIISNYSSRAIELLLPELERGMLDTAWRIRLSSISLTGELLYKITGISGKVEIEEDEAPAQNNDATRKALVEALGPEGRDRVLAILYVVRQDSVHQVRTASIHIWKALVSNTPRTTREILPTLITVILQLLGSEADEQQQTASRTLGELVRKSGERILGEIVPMLKKAVVAPEAKQREGACLAFTEIMRTANEDALEAHEDAVISAIRVALVDDNTAVRIAAAQTFDIMQEQIGSKAIDEIIPTLLEAMGQAGESSETALMALKEVMSVRAHTVFPTLLPTLTAQPISAFNARALASLVTVAGGALSKRLSSVLTPLVKSMETQDDGETLSAVQDAVRALLASISDSEGMHSLQMLLLGWAKDNSPKRRVQACNLLAIFCEVGEQDLADYRVDWVRQLIAMFEDPIEEAITAAWEAMDALVKSIDKDSLDSLVIPLRRGLESLGAKEKQVPGLSRPKGPQPIVPILLAGLLGGTQEQKEQAAYGIGDLVQRTSEAAIKPYIIQLTGPLIRVISAGNITPQIKGSILSTLTILLEEVPGLVRPFHPQLTRTMVKSASDSSSLSVRNRAVQGLGELIKHQPRVDPVVTELVAAVRSSESDIAPSIAEALAAICKSASKTIGAAAKDSILEFVDESFGQKLTEPLATGIAKIIASLASNEADTVDHILKSRIVSDSPPSLLKSITLLQMYTIAPGAFADLGLRDASLTAIQNCAASDVPAISRPCREAKELAV